MDPLGTGPDKLFWKGWRFEGEGLGSRVRVSVRI